MKVLGLDTTADDTCAAVVEDGQRILSNIVCSQSPLHAKYGGIVPQIAAYEHLRHVLPVVDEACRRAHLPLDGIDLLATGQAYDRAHTYYRVCVDTARVLARVLSKPLVGVDHVEAHVCVNFTVHPELSYPFVCLTVAGGHTILALARGQGEYQLLGQTRDDAAGEAFDKVARILGFGYPGGPVIDLAAEKGNPRAFPFKSPLIDHQGFDFSYAGLKTAVLYEVSRLKKGFGSSLPEGVVWDLAASFRQAAVAVLVTKLFQAAVRFGVKRVVLGGGVAANKRLRQMVDEGGRQRGLVVYYPPSVLCTDNAVGTAALGYSQFKIQGGDELLNLSYFRESVLGKV